MRQELSHYRSPWVWLPVLVSAFLILPGLIMPFVTIDLRSVRITGATSAMQATVVAHRETHFDFTGRFTVAFRHVGDDLLVCTPRPTKPFDYTGGLTKPVERPLYWWAGGMQELQRCVDEGLRDGVFYAVTCHDWLVMFDLPLARRCVRSNDFILGGL